jgi:hypothetical protein
VTPRRGVPLGNRNRARHPACPSPQGSRKPPAEPGAGRPGKAVPAHDEDGGTPPSAQLGGAATAALEERGSQPCVSAAPALPRPSAVAPHQPPERTSGVVKRDELEEPLARPVP